MSNYFHNLASFHEIIFSLNYPMLLPILLIKWLVKLYLAFLKRKFIHQNKIQTNSKTHYITFFTLQIFLIDIMIRKLFEMMSNKQVRNIFMSLILCAIPLSQDSVSLFKASYSNLKSFCDKNIINVYEISDFSLVKILDKRTYLRHYVQLCRKTDSFSILLQKYT